MVLQVDNKELVTNGVFPRLLRLHAEYYEYITDPDQYIADVKRSGPVADIFTFVDRFSSAPKMYEFYSEPEDVAVLKISSYDNWWTKQINDKTRNMIRRAQKAKVEIRLVPFEDELIHGIKAIYDESPIRQGKKFTHYQKSIETLMQEHSTFLKNSQFIGAFYDAEMIGFIKLVHDQGVSHLMQILSMIKHRDKAPTNALVAKAVEVCAEKGIPLLHYSDWTRRGLGDFKKHHGFEPLTVPRYFVPLNFRGKVALALKLHKKFSELLPENWVDLAVKIRNDWNMKRGSNKSP